jgi:hypothetical protein
MAEEVGCGQGLRQAVGDIVIGRDVWKYDFLFLDAVLDMMVTNVDMFSAAVKCLVVSHYTGHVVVASDGSRTGDGYIHISEEGT